VKNDVNVHSKSKKQKLAIVLHLEGHRRKEQDPDLYRNVKDPEQCNNLNKIANREVEKKTRCTNFYLFTPLYKLFLLHDKN